MSGFFSHLRNSRQRRSFVMFDLATFLGLAVLLILGFCQRHDSSNKDSPSKDSAMAEQQIQLVTAAKAFLGSADGQQWMASHRFKVNYPLPLPVTNLNKSDCKHNDPDFKADPHLQSFCDFLPIGFTAKTMNAYGNVLNIRIVPTFQPQGSWDPNTVFLTYRLFIHPIGSNGYAEGSDLVCEIKIHPAEREPESVCWSMP